MPSFCATSLPISLPPLPYSLAIVITIFPLLEKVGSSFSSSFPRRSSVSATSFLMKNLAIIPTISAAIIVPIPTPFNLWKIRKAETPAIIVIEASKQTFVVPKSVLNLTVTAFTKASPGSITTSAITSAYTPKPSIIQPRISATPL